MGIPISMAGDWNPVDINVQGLTVALSLGEGNVERLLDMASSFLEQQQVFLFLFFCLFYHCMRP